MNHRAVLTCLAAAFCAAAPAVAAQATDHAGTPPPNASVIDGKPPASTKAEETIVVQAPREVKTPRSKEAYAGDGFMATTVSIPVLFSDLDLTRDSDVKRLYNRVDRVASDACAELDRVYPLDPDADCVSRAEVNGRKAAQVVIDAARATKP